jgi:hypothetical protein
VLSFNTKKFLGTNLKKFAISPEDESTENINLNMQDKKKNTPINSNNYALNKREFLPKGAELKREFLADISR